MDYIVRSYDQNFLSHATFHFNHFDPKNAMVPMMMMLASSNASAITNGIT